MFGTDHSLSFLKLTLQLDEVFRSFPSIPNFTLVHFFVAGRNVCLSLCGGSHVAKSIFSNSAKRYYFQNLKGGRLRRTGGYFFFFFFLETKYLTNNNNIVGTQS